MAGSSRDSTVDENSNNSIAAMLGAENVEAFEAIWVYKDVEFDNSTEFRMKLESLFDCVRTYKNSDMEICVEFMRAQTSKEFILIITIESAQGITQDIHDLQHVHSIYIYNLSDLINNYRLQSYAKVERFN